eukprot:347924-Chlamydomonas_euryale.AAC.1
MASFADRYCCGLKVWGCARGECACGKGPILADDGVLCGPVMASFVAWNSRGLKVWGCAHGACACGKGPATLFATSVFWQQEIQKMFENAGMTVTVTVCACVPGGQGAGNVCCSHISMACEVCASPEKGRWNTALMEVDMERYGKLQEATEYCMEHCG